MIYRHIVLAKSSTFNIVSISSFILATNPYFNVLFLILVWDFTPCDDQKQWWKLVDSKFGYALVKDKTSFIQLGCVKCKGFHEDMRHTQFGGDVESWNCHLFIPFFPHF